MATVTRSTVARAVVVAVVALGALAILFSVPALAATDHEPTAANTTLDPSTPTLEAAPGQLIEGSSDAHAGVDLTVRIVLFPDGPAFERAETATVDATGTFRTTTNLSVVPAETPARLVVEHEGSELVNVSTTVGPCETTCGIADREAGSERETDIDFVGEHIELEAGPGRTIRGETDHSPGTDITVRLLATGDTPVMHTTQTTVAADGTFRAVIDLSGTDNTDYAGTEFDVTVLVAGSTTVETTLRAVECMSDCELPSGDPTAPEFGDEFEETGELGDAFLLPVDLHGEESAWLNITAWRPGDTDRFTASLRVHDGTGDDRVVVVFDSNAEGPPLFAADHGDEVVIENRSGTITGASYEAVLLPEPVWEADESIEIYDVERIEIEDRETTPEPTETTGTPTDSDERLVPLAGFVFAGLIATAGIALLTGRIDIDRGRR